MTIVDFYRLGGSYSESLPYYQSLRKPLLLQIIFEMMSTCTTADPLAHPMQAVFELLAKRGCR
jgi:hypothetical protein